MNKYIKIICIRWIQITFTLFLVFGCAGTAHKNLDEYFTESMEHAGFVGMQAAYIQNGELAWSGNYGVRNFNSGKVVDDSTVFMIASCSKPVTALAFMVLYDRGMIDWDDPINDHLPFKVLNPYHPDRAITIRMLLSHTSSLRDNWDIITPLYTLENGGGDSPISLEELNKSYFMIDGKFYDQAKNFSSDAPGDTRR